jgi:hypothetical protein
MLAGVGTMHIKFGLRAAGLVTVVALLLWCINRTANRSLSHIAILLGGFLIAISPTIFQLLESNAHLLASQAPSSAEVPVDVIGWLYKEEPNNWLASFNAFDGPMLPILVPLISLTALAVAAIVAACGQSPRLRFVGRISACAVVVSSLAYGAGWVFESLLTPMLPLRLAHSLLMMRFWELFWVPWVALGVCVLVGADSLVPRAPVYLLILVPVGGSLLIQAASAIKAGALAGGLFAPPHSPPPAAEFVWYEYCAPGSSYESILARALVAAEHDDSASLAELTGQLDAMNRAGPAAVGGAKFAVDPQAEALRALSAFRRRDYIGGLERLWQVMRLQGRGDRNSAERAWSGEVIWTCSADAVPGKLTRRVLSLSGDDYSDVTRWIDRNLPANAGVITPPYTRFFAAAARRVPFWEVAHDGDSMYLYPGYLRAGYERLVRVAGDGAMMVPSLDAIPVAERGRLFFLDRDEDDLRKIRSRYPGYDYLLTESSVQLHLPLLHRNQSFALYRIE